MNPSTKRILKNKYLRAKRTTPNYYVYVLECDDDTYYTGYSKDLAKRVIDHKLKKGARYTKKRECKLAYFETHQTKEEALNRERLIKDGGSVYKKILCRKFKMLMSQLKND